MSPPGGWSGQDVLQCRVRLGGVLVQATGVKVSVQAVGEGSVAAAGALGPDGGGQGGAESGQAAAKRPVPEYPLRLPGAVQPGIRFESDKVHVKFLSNPYPLVRWTDRRGMRWEHHRGEVRQVRDGEGLGAVAAGH